LPPKKPDQCCVYPKARKEIDTADQEKIKVANHRTFEVDPFRQQEKTGTPQENTQQ
jgi:hypothetical protein